MSHRLLKISAYLYDIIICLHTRNHINSNSLSRYMAEVVHNTSVKKGSR